MPLWVAAGALVLSVAALALVAWRILAPAGSPCQSTAWSAMPAAGSLPDGWTVRAAQYDPDRLSATIVGPAPQDQAGAQPVAYITVTCYRSDAAGALERAQATLSGAGLSVTPRSDLGDGGFSAVDSSGSSFVEFRRADVVADIAASGASALTDSETLASAVDAALAGGAGAGGGAAPTVLPSGLVEPVPTGPTLAPGATLPVGPEATASVEPSAAAAPELESALPRSLGGTELTVDSALGTAVLGQDAGSRAITAALRSAGHTGDDLRVAEAYDPTGATDASVLGFRVEGMTGPTLEKLIMDTWLAAGGSGVTTATKTIGGKKVTVIDYGDGGPASYVLTSGDKVFVVGTADAKVAAEALAALP